MALDPAFTRDPLPASLDRWRIVLAPGAERRSDPSEWSGCLVLVEQGTVEVVCTAGGHRSFGTGDVLALQWVPVRALRNPGAEETRLLAIRRKAPVG